MWAIENQTPYAAERCWVRDRRGAEVWIVAVRATYDLFPDGYVQLANPQPSVVLAPEFTGEPGQSSLKCESDLLLTKIKTDVLFHGSAHAPHREPALDFEAELRLGPVSKKIRVVGNRHWEKAGEGVRLSEPEPFITMPICYERAFGGKDPASEAYEKRNPIGVGYADDPRAVLGLPAPNIEHPSESLHQPTDRPAPIGLGPIARHWSPRIERAGSYDERWAKTRKPLLPDDFDDAFYQSAPEDQQVEGYLKGGETIQLTNLTPPGHTEWVLPRVHLGFRTQVRDKLHLHRAGLHSVIIEPDDLRLTLVWQTAFPCHRDVDHLKGTFIFEKEVLNRATA